MAGRKIQRAYMTTETTHETYKRLAQIDNTSMSQLVEQAIWCLVSQRIAQGKSIDTETLILYFKRLGIQLETKC